MNGVFKANQGSARTVLLSSSRAGLSALLLAAAALVGCSSEQKTVSAAPEKISNVSVLSVHRANVPDLLETVGTVRPAQTSLIASQMMGNIVDIRVHEGDRVRRGQVLAVIDDAQPRANLDRATAAELASGKEISATDSEYVLAEATYGRYQTLLDRKSVSPQEFDEVKARYQAAQARRDMAVAGQSQAKAALEQARTAAGYSRVLAPFDGVVTEKKVDVGTLASPGMPLFTVEDVRRYRLEATVNESDLRFVRAGQQVPVLIDALGDKESTGKVVEIVPAADPGSRSFLVKIELSAEAALRSGLFGRAEFTRGERTSLLIPQSSIVERGQLQGVYVLDSNHIASLRYITIGKPSGQQVEVLAGLQDGETVVADHGGQDLGGKKIESN
jgi:RND family efflux transporter MFP subunit